MEVRAPLKGRGQGAAFRAYVIVSVHSMKLSQGEVVSRRRTPKKRAAASTQIWSDTVRVITCEPATRRR